MITHGMIDLLCTPIWNIFGRKVCNERSLTEPEASMQELREMV